jgi:HEAT repeat protein/MFS family permease
MNMQESSDILVEDRPEPTNLQKIRGIPWSISFNVLNTFFIQFTFFGSVFVLFLDELGLDKGQIGFILALLPFFDLISLFLASAVSRFGYKLTFWGARTVVSALLLVIPAVLGNFGPQAGLLFISGIVIAFSTSRSVAITALNPWQQEYVPASMWGKYSATNTMFTSLAGVIAVTIAGYVVNYWNDLTGYMVLFAVSLAFGALSVWSASFIPGGAPVRQASPQKKKVSSSVTLRDKRFRSYLIGAGLITLATVPLGAFVPLFMQDVVGISAGNVVYLQTGALIGGLVSVYLWGWAADRYGSRPVMLTGVIFTALLPILWLLMPYQSPWSFPIALGIAFLRGALISSWAIGSVRMLYAFVVPPEFKIPYMAVYTAWMGITAGVSQLAGGWLLDRTAGIQSQLWVIQIDSYTVLFVLCMLLAAASAVFLRQVMADSRVTVGQFAGLFFHGNPFMAMGSLIRYQFARDEIETIFVTEDLGRSASPLTVDELLQALRDPRFYVRFEAIVSIARRPPDEALLEALADVLRGDDPSLSVIAAWALGRIGDQQAVGPLRESLDSPYRSIRAHAARSLGSLEDEPSGPVMLAKLRQEPDHGLQVAYAAALGKLEYRPAVPALLDLLAAEADPDSRQELALALARMTGDENTFVHLWRDAGDDPGTTLSQAILAFRKKLAAVGELPGCQDELENCLEAFARQDLEAGAVELVQLLDTLPEGHFHETAWKILQASQDQIQKEHAARLEYLVLAVHTLNNGWLESIPPGFGQPDLGVV